MSGKKKETKTIELSRCFSCGKTYLFKLLTPFILVESFEDGVNKSKRYLCEECYDRLKQVSFVLECDSERKKLKGKKEDEEE